MEVFMNHEVQELLKKAVKIVAKTGTKPGTRYPKALKKIVISLRLDHEMSVNDVIKHVGVSSYSAREWPKVIQQKNQFNKISIIKNPDNKTQTEVKSINYSEEFKKIIFNLKVLITLITLLIFESLVIHLIS
jgi:transposase-like protein